VHTAAVAVRDPTRLSTAAESGRVAAVLEVKLQQGKERLGGKSVGLSRFIWFWGLVASPFGVVLIF